MKEAKAPLRQNPNSYQEYQYQYLELQNNHLNSKNENIVKKNQENQNSNQSYRHTIEILGQKLAKVEAKA